MGFSFNQTTGRLSINTSMMDLIFENGAIIYIKDIASNEVILDCDYGSPPVNSKTNGQFIGFRNVGGDYGQYIPKEGSSNCSGSLIPPNHYQVTYSPCVDSGGSDQIGSHLIYDIYIDVETGEVYIQSEGYTPTATDPPTTIAFPITNITNAVIVGALKINPTDASQNWGTDGYWDNTHYPQVAVIEGTNAVCGIWNEQDQTVWQNMAVNHVLNGPNTPDDYTHLPFYSKRNPIQLTIDDQYIYQGPIRITTQANWLEVARRWRVRWESTNPDQEKLWENANSWVQDIHCVCALNGWDDNSAWDAVAAISPGHTERILSYPSTYWSGTLVADGDNKWFLDWQVPTQSVAAHWASEGYQFKVCPHKQWALHYPPDLYYTNPGGGYDGQHNALPAGWYWNSHSDNSVTYDMPGDTTMTVDQFWPLYSSYWDNKYIWYNPPTNTEIYLHPGSNEGRAYLAYNMRKFFTENPQYHGAYLDTLGDMVDFHFVDAGIGVIDGYSWTTGMVAMCQSLYTDYPIITEMCCMAVMPYCFFSWWTTDYNGLNYTPNHPLFAALRGSYTWFRIYSPPNTDNLSLYAYLGMLPELPADPSSNAYLTAVARMFCLRELHHDLPDTWSTGALAYYRSNTGNMVRFEDRGSNVYAYVEEYWQGDYDRLVIDDGVVTTDNIDEELPNSYYTRGSYISLPSGDTDLATSYTVDDIADVVADDTDMVAQLATSQIAIHQFKQQIAGLGGIISVVAQVTIPCSTSTTYLQIYNRSGTPAWETIDYDDATGANIDFPLFANVADLTDYKDINNIVACRVYQEMQ